LNYEDQWAGSRLLDSLQPTVLVLRTLPNLVASRMKQKQERAPAMCLNDSFYNMYIDMAAAALDTDLAPFPDLYVILYDKWFMDEAYRRQVTDDLNARWGLRLVYNEDALNTVVNCEKWGSSFDGHAFQGKAQEMNVLRRYEQFGLDLNTLPEDCKAYDREIRNAYQLD
jgi:hypothetical protein